MGADSGSQSLSKYKTLVIAVKNYAKADVQLFCPCLIMLDFFTLFLIFYSRLLNLHHYGIRKQKLMFQSLSWYHGYNTIISEHDSSKKMEILVKRLFLSSIIVCNIMKLLVKLFIIKLNAATKLQLHFGVICFTQNMI